LLFGDTFVQLEQDSTVQMRLAFPKMRLAYFEKQGTFVLTASRILENARRIFRYVALMSMNVLYNIKYIPYNDKSIDL